MNVVHFWLGLKFGPNDGEFAALITGMPDDVAREIADTDSCVLDGQRLQYFHCGGEVVGFGIHLTTHAQSEGPSSISSNILALNESAAPWLDRLLWDWGLRMGTKGYRSKVWFQSDQPKTNTDKDVAENGDKSASTLLN